MKIETPRDPRLDPLVALRRFMPLPPEDAEARAERKMLRRMDIKEAVSK